MIWCGVQIWETNKDGRTHRRWYSYLYKGFSKMFVVCRISVKKNTHNIFLEKSFGAAILKIQNAHALQTSANQTQPVNIPCRVVNHLCCISAGLSGGVGVNVHVLHGNIPNTRPPNPHGASAVVSYRACARVVCEHSDAIPTKRFTSPMPKAAQLKNEMRKGAWDEIIKF